MLIGSKSTNKKDYGKVGKVFKNIFKHVCFVIWYGEVC